MTAGAAVQKLGTKLQEEQEIIMNLADMLMDLYLAESTLLRVMKLTDILGYEKTGLPMDIFSTFLADATDRIAKNGKEAIAAFAEGDELRMMLMGLKRFTKTDPFNTKDARRRIAAKLIEENKYCF